MCPIVGPSNDCDVIVNGVSTKCLLDTGSMVVTLARSFYDSHLADIPLEPLDRLFSIQLASGQSLPYDGVVQVSLQFPSGSLPIDYVLVVPALVIRDNSVPVIVGTNIIQQCIQTDKSQSGFTSLQGSSLPWNMAYQGMVPDSGVSRPTTIGEVYSTQVVSVPSGESIEVVGLCKLSLACGNDLVLTEESQQALPGGLVLNPSVHELQQHKNPQINVQISNVSRKSVSIPANVVLCSLQTVQVVHSFPESSRDVQQQQCNSKSNATDVRDEELLKLFHIEDCSAKDRLSDLLLKWRDVFSQGDFDIGKTSLVKHRINLTDEKPVKLRHRRIPPSMYEEVRKHLDSMLQCGVIRPSKSPWAFPTVLVRKKDGSLRFCIDYRQLNNKTIRDSYQLPRIDESLDALAGAKYFSTLDLKSGYWQIEVEEEHKERTAFTVGPLGFWECNLMPFGLNNAPATFQRLMEQAMGDLHLRKCLIYLDDVIIFSKTVDEHLERLQEVFARLKSAGLKLKPSKCNFLQQKVKYLGHIVSADGIATDPDKIAAIKDWRTPQTVEEVRRFLGFTGFYRKFIDGYASIVKPLTSLLASKPKSSHRNNKKTKTPAAFVWSDKQQEAFNHICQKLMSTPVLGFADYKLPFELHTDASLNGLGAVLYQTQNGRKRVIAYASRSLTAAEQKYPIHKLEFLALKWSVCDKFHDYLYGSEFAVYTDNNPLTYVLTTAKLDATGHRWLAGLSTYNFSIHYVAGQQNVDADSLSRAVRDNAAERVEAESINAICSALSADVSLVDTVCSQQVSEEFPSTKEIGRNFDVASEQHKDAVVGLLLQWKLDKHKPSAKELSGLNPEVKRFVSIWESLVLKNGVLYRLKQSSDGGESVCQLVLPLCLRKYVTDQLHTKLGHPGRDRTLDLIQQRFYWPSMSTEIAKFVGECRRCICRKSRHNVQAPLVSIKTSQPLELLCIDFLSLETSKGGFENILVITDHFTKFAQAVPTKNQLASTVAKVLVEKFIFHYGIPQRLHSDQGKNFLSNVIKQLCSILGMEKSRTTPYHPSGNGACERFNSTLLNMLGTLTEEEKINWKDHVSSIVWAYNCTRHESMGYSPYYLMFGRHPQLPIDVMFGLEMNKDTPTLAKYTRDVADKLSKAFERAVSTRDRMSSKNEEIYNRKVRGAALEVGDLVLVRNVGLSGKHKLADHYADHPYKIIGRPNLDIPVYKIKDLEGGKVRTLHRNMLLPIASSDNIKLHPTINKTNKTKRDEKKVVNPEKVEREERTSEERSDDSQDEQSDSEDIVVEVIDTSQPEIEEQHQQDDDDENGDNDDKNETGQDQCSTSETVTTTTPPVPAPRRSTRLRKAPKWTQDYVMCNEMAASTSSQETRYRVIQDAIRVLGHVVDTL